MTELLECPRCHRRAESRGGGWRNRACLGCGAPMVIARDPTEALIRRYMHGDRLAPQQQPWRRASG